MASLIMLAAIVVSSLGTRRNIASFAPLPPKRPFIFARSAAEVWGTLINRPFLLLFSANAFALKAVSGIGVFGAGLILTYVEFPSGAQQGQVSAEVLRRFAATEPSIVLALSIVATLLIVADRCFPDHARVPRGKSANAVHAGAGRCARCRTGGQWLAAGQCQPPVQHHA